MPEQFAGTDPAGALTVTIDERLRVAWVEVHSPDRVRLTDDLAEAVKQAYRSALREKHEPQRVQRRARRAPDGQRPVAVSTPVRLPELDHSLLQRHQVRDATREERRQPRRLPRPAVGRSRNGCVLVRLGLISPIGPVEADPGWLATATATNLGAALTEAFRSAYEERGI